MLWQKKTSIIWLHIFIFADKKLQHWAVLFDSNTWQPFLPLPGTWFLLSPFLVTMEPKASCLSLCKFHFVFSIHWRKLCDGNKWRYQILYIATAINIKGNLKLQTRDPYSIVHTGNQPGRDFRLYTPTKLSGENKKPLNKQNPGHMPQVLALPSEEQKYLLFLLKKKVCSKHANSGKISTPRADVYSEWNKHSMKSEKAGEGPGVR